MLQSHTCNGTKTSRSPGAVGWFGHGMYVYPQVMHGLLWILVLKVHFGGGRPTFGDRCSPARSLAESSLYIGDAWILLRKTSTSGNQKKKRDIPGAIPFHDVTPGETVIKEETSMAQKTHECCT